MGARGKRLAGVCGGLLLAWGGWAPAGPIDPPSGPVQSTFKTLAEVEPRIAINAVNTPGDADSLYRITQPGSYYLTGGIVGEKAKSGIEVAVGGVTIDLAGFTMTGVPGSLSGIVDEVAFTAGVSVRNGTVTAWGDRGVSLQRNPAIVERILASENGTEGINAGPGSVVRACVASSNGRDGIRAGTGATVTGCSAVGNAADGISVNSRSTVTECAAEGNAGNGMSGVFGALIARCVSGSNTGAGISVDQGCTVAECYVSTNTADGIVTSGDGAVLDCVCDGNGRNSGVGAGILVTGSDNRIEGNNCVDNDFGVRATSSGNIIVRNTCSGNTTLNWEIVANNKCLVVVAANAGAISGDAGGTGFGSTDPNANFTY